MCIRVSVQRNHLFGKTNTQKTVVKVKNLCTEKKPSFVYLCIGAKKSQPYSDILCLNGWTYDSLPLILVPRSFRDLYLPLYKCAKAVLSFVIIHPSVLQKLKCGNKYSLTKLKTESAKLASSPS